MVKAAAGLLQNVLFGVQRRPNLCGSQQGQLEQEGEDCALSPRSAGSLVGTAGVVHGQGGIGSKPG